MAVYELTRLHKDKILREMSRKLLRNVLRALTETYPAEQRSFSGRIWPSQGQEGNDGQDAKEMHWEHWQAWGRHAEFQEAAKENARDLDIRWHVPNSRELRVGQALLETHLSPHLQTLRVFVQTTRDKTKSSERVGAAALPPSAVAAAEMPRCGSGASGRSLSRHRNSFAQQRNASCL